MEFNIGIAIGGLIVATWGKYCERILPLWATAIASAAGSISYTIITT